MEGQRVMCSCWTSVLRECSDTWDQHNYRCCSALLFPCCPTLTEWRQGSSWIAGAVSSYVQLARHSFFLILAHYLSFRSNPSRHGPLLRLFRRVRLEPKLSNLPVSRPLRQLFLASYDVELICENMNFVHIR